MKITDLLIEERIELDVDISLKEECIKHAVSIMDRSGNISDVEKYEKAVFEREAISTTGVGNSIAIPHCQSDFVKEAGLVALRLNESVDWQSLDGEPVKLIFLIAAPAKSKDNIHLEVLAKLSRMLMHNDFVESLLNAKDKKEFLEILDKNDSDSEP